MGKVTSVTLARDVPALLGKLSVSTVWKGPLDRTVHVYTSYGDWGAYFEEGETFLVYAYYRDESGPYLWADLCTTYSMSRLRELREYHHDELAELGRGFPIGIVHDLALGILSAGLLSGMLWLGWRTRKGGR